MFKRVAKRIRKKEREEELGLDGELKEILGMNNIDSDDDSSDSDSGGSSDEDRPAKQVSGAQSDDSDEDSDGESDEEEADEDEELDGELDAGEGSEVLGSEADQSEDEEDEDEDEEGEPPMSVSEALQNPLYIVSLEPEIKACVVCPGKLIKNPIMGDVHIKSTAHTRRFTRVREAAMAVDADTDIRLLVRAAFAPQEAKKAAESTSKRAQKKKAKLDAIKAKRANQKAMRAKAQARKEAKPKPTTSDADDSDHSVREKQPAAKKRKVQQPDGGNDSPKITAKKTKILKSIPPTPDARPALAKKSDARPKPAEKADARLGQRRPKAKAGAAVATGRASSGRANSKTAEGAKSKKRRRSEASS